MIGMLLALVLVQPPPTDTLATMYGLGPLRIGMPVSALRGLGAVPDFQPDEAGGCHYWRFPQESQENGLGLMVVDDRLARIDIHQSYGTASGARIGMTEAEIRAIYGPRMRVEPHPYTGPDGHYLIYQARDEPFGLIVETDHESGRAIMLRVGLWENVQWIEGCS